MSDVFEVLDGGLLTIVVDAGRPALASLGLAPGGAADPWSLAVANALAEAPPGAAALEMTLAGPTLRALRPVTVALAGADLGAVIEPGGRLVAAGTSHALAAGDVLRFAGRGGRGARGYLAVPGGFDVPTLLGSRSTALGPGFGGLDGRAVRAGDTLAAGVASIAPPSRWPGSAMAPHATDADGAWRLRITAGPWAADHPETLAALAAHRWTVDAASDRVGLRLGGDPLPGAYPADLASHGLVTGAIQVPPGGRPIVLLPDRQPTGGYAVPAVVIGADRAALGQLAPGDTVTFRAVSVAEAADALRAAHDAMDAALRHLDDDRRWDALTAHAGG